MGAKLTSYTLLFQLGATVKKSPWHLKIPQPRQGHNPSQSSGRVSLHSDSTLSQKSAVPYLSLKDNTDPISCFLQGLCLIIYSLETKPAPKLLMFLPKLPKGNQTLKQSTKNDLEVTTDFSTLMMPIIHSFFIQTTKISEASKTSINVTKCFS